MAKTMIPLEGLHDALRSYRAEIQRDVSSSKGHIYYSRPLRKWILVRRKGNKAELGFYDDCPCDKT